MRELLRQQRLLSLGVVVDDLPVVGLLPFLAAPTFPDDLGVRHSRAAATETGGRVAIVTDGVARSWKIAGTNSDLAALAWSADASVGRPS